MQQMVVCPNCGSQNSAGQQFCVSCGAHLANTQRPESHTPIVTGVVNPAPIAASVSPMLTQTAVQARTQSRVEVKPTWGLAWGLLWRMVSICIFVVGAAFLIYMLVRLIMGYNDVFGAW